MPSEISYPVDYVTHSGTARNLDLRGKGLLVIRHTEHGTIFEFSGAERRASSLERRLELSFREEQIWNVEVEGRCIQFSTTVGRSGERRKPFVFCCPAIEDTLEVARQLPKTKDADFVAAEEFTERLHRLPAAARPWTSITNLLIGANGVAFILMGLAGAGWFEVESMQPYVRYGANSARLTTDGQWWRVVSCMFLHYGLIHLALNMWALFQAGHLLEKLLGRPLFALVYFGSGIMGSFVSLVSHGDKLSAGASGAVFGTFGALIGYMIREKHALPRTVFQPLLKSTLAFTAYNLLFGMIHPKIDNAAHMGGVIGGVLLGWLVALPVDPAVRAKRMWPRLVLGATVLVVAVAIGVLLARGMRPGRLPELL